MSGDLLVNNVRPHGGAAANLLVKSGVIAAVGPAVTASGVETVDGGGAILLPGLVEAHAHLDKTLLGMPWYRNEVGPRLIDKIDNERRQKSVLGIDPARQSARQVVQSSAFGSTHIRTHVDIDTEGRLAGVEGVLKTREAYGDLVDMDLVAFPQSGMLVRPGTLELMEEALKLGVENVGGIDPSSIDRDPKGHLDAVFGLADRYGRGVDIHLHEPGELGAFSLELMIERTRALGMQGKVVASHAFCLGMADEAYVDRLIEGLRGAGIHVMTTAPGSRPVPPLRKLRAAGVTVCAGSDGIRDTWGPYGDADMLERAMFLGMRFNLRRDDEVEIALDVCTHGGAKVMGLKGYGLNVGDKGDFVLVAGESVADAVVSRKPRQLVVKRGKIVARDGQSVRTAP
jgi:cytosine/adenosine deaminase-related metal-dependent hydrolase